MKINYFCCTFGGICLSVSCFQEKEKTTKNDTWHTLFDCLFHGSNIISVGFRLDNETFCKYFTDSEYYRYIISLYAIFIPDVFLMQYPVHYSVFSCSGMEGGRGRGGWEISWNRTQSGGIASRVRRQPLDWKKNQKTTSSKLLDEEIGTNLPIWRDLCHSFW